MSSQLMTELIKLMPSIEPKYFLWKTENKRLLFGLPPRTTTSAM
ncbi:hypothetical protein CU025_0581 [Enterococcus faecium]|nr:hypothetical protein [Enterococcus faecium]MBK4766022.1 hypothetical protein [Enterococcus faecium]MBK4792475.1 hypothetical protein [Enterococcus faecium]MBK4794965.1 hypothetical protein [Enterococcus faecium]MBK4800473.1 hypothetical protein [Enterococcus faecium]